MTAMNSAVLPEDASAKIRYSRFLLLVSGLGGLLYGIDVGIIAGALPYLEATSHLTAAQLSVIVAPVLLGGLLQGMSGGLIGVVGPLYLAECLPASSRGKGTAIFQWLLTLGLVTAALGGCSYDSP